MDNPIVSVIVPCYNHGEFLKECLDSVLAQTYNEWECIIIDNGSTDNTKSITEQYIQRDKRITYLFCNRKGVSVARNLGINNSAGIYILPLDADDKIATSYLQKAVSVLEKNSNIKIVYSNARFFGEAFRKWDLPSFTTKEMLVENIIFCSALFRRTDYDMTKGYNEEMVTGFEDWDFWLQMIKLGGDVYKIPEILFFYRIRNKSRNKSISLEKEKSLRGQIYKNHKELYDSVFYIPDFLFEFNFKKKQINYLLHSPDYKIGRTLLAPLRYVKKIFWK